MQGFWKNAALSIGLFSVLLGAYLLTYRGVPLSGDELAMFSATESLVKYDESRLYSVYYQYPGAGEIPWSKPVHEPMQITLSIPLYWLAYQIDGIGMLHSVWLFNVLVTAAIGVVIFWTGITLNYRWEVSITVALIIGLATMLWPYTQTFFREPLAAFWVALTFLLAFQLQQRWQMWKAGLLMLVCAAALLTKEIMFLSFPALLIVLWPSHLTRRTLFIGTVMLMGGIIFVVGIYSLVSETNFGSNRYDSQGYLGRVEQSSLDYFLTVIGAYLFSPGRSLWATSPILLLSFYGSWLAYRAGRWRLALAPFILLLTVTAGYGVGGWDWHGGLGWGTRYLLHIVPVMGLLLLPVLQLFFERSVPRFWWLIGAVLLVFSVLVQLGGLLVPTPFAFEILLAEFPEKGARAFQEEATWTLRYTQWYLHLKNVNFDALAVAWRYTSVGLFAAGFFITAGVILIGWKGRVTKGTFLMQFVVLLALWTIGIGLTFQTLEDDPRFKADRPELQQLMVSLEQQAGERDMVLLANPDYLYFFLNSYRGKGVLVTLPYLAGERYSPDQPDPVVEDFDRGGGITPNERIDSATSRIMNYLNRRYPNVWLVMNSGPFLPWAYRPVEEILTSNYFPVSESKWAEDARLIRIYPYYNYLVPALVTRREPFTFGENLRLVGYDAAYRIESGSVLPVVLAWQKTGQVDFNYNIGVSLIDKNGVLRAQHDGAPQATFGDTSKWEVGKLYFDPHGLALPADLPPGEYTLRVVMYDWRDAIRLPVTFAGQTRDFADLATVEVVAPGTYSPPQTYEITDHLPDQDALYKFGESIRLTGYKFLDEVESGSLLIITTTWEVQKAGNFNATISLYQNNEIQTAVNGLAVSVYNEKFHEGQQTYRHEIIVPESFPSGTYQVIVSVFDWSIPAPFLVAPQGTGKNYEAVLGAVEVTASR